MRVDGRRNAQLKDEIHLLQERLNKLEMDCTKKITRLSNGLNLVKEWALHESKTY